MEKIPRPEIPVRVDRADGNQFKDIMTKMGKAMATQDKYFVKNFEVVKVMTDHEKNTVTRQPNVHEFVTDVEEFVYPYKEERKKLAKNKEDENNVLIEAGLPPKHEPEKKQVYSPLQDNFANKVIFAERFMAELPHIRATFKCPMLVLRPDGRLDEICGYDRKSGIWCQGAKTQEMSVEEAIEVIDEILEDFRFLEKGDHARAIASLLSPAMHYAGLINGRIPFDVTEADASQSGKGFRNQIVEALYNTKIGIVNWGTGKKGVADNPVESFFNYMYDGFPFICLDNVRGKLEEQTLESFATEKTIRCRILMKAKIMDPRDFCVFITSNAATMNKDMVNRSSIVRIRKRHDPVWRKYGPDTNDNIVMEIGRNRSRFLGAVFTIIKDWHAEGGHTLKCEHNMNTFNAWFEKMNYIVNKHWKLGDITQGMKDIQNRVTSRNLTTCRALANVINQANQLGEWLVAGDLASMLLDNEDGKVAIGVNPNAEDLNKAIGGRLSNIFRGQPDGIIWFQVAEGYVIQRMHSPEIKDKHGNRISNSQNYYRAIRLDDHERYVDEEGKVKEYPVGEFPSTLETEKEKDNGSQALFEEIMGASSELPF